MRFHPKNQENIYYDWMLNLRPWCISRQLWWGHQIPVWYCPDGHETVALSEPAACATCGSAELERDPDVLDTWFSSALWPFATLGWPDGDDPRLERYYPGHVLATARDIINLWVARMLMMGLEFMGEIPFEDVVINPRSWRRTAGGCRSRSEPSSTRRSWLPTAGGCRSRSGRASTRSSWWTATAPTPPGTASSR